MIEKFWSRVDRSGGDDACWPWTGSRNNTGYGIVWWEGKVVTAHRVSALLSGLVNDVTAPKDKTARGFILHQCDNPICCNPRHFKVGTYGENQMEAYARKRRSQPRGHMHVNSKLSPSNVESIRSTYAAGVMSQDKLAAKYGVSQRSISLIVRGETYKCQE